MKRIIDGKRYDTETATVIHEWSNHYSGSDFHYAEETLYKTPRGNWFLYGKGGALSRWSKPYGNNGSTGGSDLRPLEPDVSSSLS